MRGYAVSSSPGSSSTNSMPPVRCGRGGLFTDRRRAAGSPRFGWRGGGSSSNGSRAGAASATAYGCACLPRAPHPFGRWPGRSLDEALGCIARALGCLAGALRGLGDALLQVLEDRQLPGDFGELVEVAELSGSSESVHDLSEPRERVAVASLQECGIEPHALASRLTLDRVLDHPDLLEGGP